MFSIARLASFTAIALPALAAATAVPRNESPGACSTAPIQCCQTTAPASSDAVAPILKAIGVVVQDVNALVGLECSPISVVGVGSGATCDANAVCCDQNNVGDSVSIGCVPVDL
ncbi:fungal hydrophobin [Panus rudis PR-1116 ss-1]|nr:fungal hydrophobin [Panus rudis PR-1116 ss-1]